MTSKTIAVSEDAYELLDKMKNKGESFTEVIRRLTKRRKLAECAGYWSEVTLAEMSSYRSVIGELRNMAPSSKEPDKD